MGKGRAMTDPRDLAVHVTAKKIAYRQSKDGMVISFVLHPQEVPDKLATDPIGTSYMLALVEIDDATGQPKGDTKPAHQGMASPVDNDASPKAPRSQVPQAESGARKSPAQVAGYLCTLPSFWKFLREHHMLPAVRTEESAAKAIRLMCGVQHRSEIRDGEASGNAWRQIRADFTAWEKAVEVVG